MNTNDADGKWDGEKLEEPAAVQESGSKWNSGTGNERVEKYESTRLISYVMASQLQSVKWCGVLMRVREQVWQAAFLQVC